MKNLSLHYSTETTTKSSIKIIALVALISLFSQTGKAQVGIGTNNPHSSAQLDISSTEKGILIPRMNESHRNAISSPETGLLIFQTDNTPGFYYYNGTSWAPLVSTPKSAPTIIPYASGTPVYLTRMGGGGAVPALVGFGSSSSLQDPTLSSSIDISSSIAGSNNINFAYSVPRAGIITSISAFFSSNIASYVPSLTITAQLYSAPSGSNTFTPLTGAGVSLTSLSGAISSGTTTTGNATVNVPVTAGSRLLLVFNSNATSGSTISGYVSAGVSIAE